MVKRLNIPIIEEEIRELSVGDSVLLSGILVTGRDAVHKWIHDTFISKKRKATQEDVETMQQLKPVLSGGIIYHCGPVIAGSSIKDYHVLAAGPTTSIREEPYQADVIKYLNLRGIIGKGGMAANTLKACQDAPAVYFHAIGGAGARIAESVVKVIAVYKLEFGIPEAIWVLQVEDFPAIVTMDAQGSSLHTLVRERSRTVLDHLLS